MTQRRFVQACESLIRIRAATRSIRGGLFQIGPQPDADGSGDSVAHSSASGGAAPALRESDSSSLGPHAPSVLPSRSDATAFAESDWSIHFQEDAASAATP
jgi:hypothetical protein